MTNGNLTDSDPWTQSDTRYYLKQHNGLNDPEIRPLDGGGWAVFPSYASTEPVTEKFDTLEAAKAAYLVML